MLRDFYLALAPVCFTLLGLWVIVAQTRHAEWRRSPLHRRRGYAVWLQFALPGLMALLSLVDTESEALWRVSFAIVAGVGALLLIALWRREHSRQANIAYGTATLLYVLITVIAIAPAVVNDWDSSINALRAEAILLSLVVFVGVNVSWFILFEAEIGDEVA
jgi:hypothetical protein